MSRSKEELAEAFKLAEFPFGTDDLYLGSHLARLVRPEGQIGIVVPGLVQEWPSADPAEHLQPHWSRDCSSFHSPDWWRRHWERSGLMTVESAGVYG